MACMFCKCGALINLDDQPEAWYAEIEGEETELEQPMCAGCKDELA